MPKNNIPKISDKDLDIAFNEKWYEDITEAALMAQLHIDPEGLESDAKIAKEVIDYNIVKTIQKIALDTLLKNLPKKLDWHQKTVMQAFNEFKEVIDSCDINPDFKKHSLKAITGRSGAMKMEFMIWCETINSYYPELRITAKLNSKNPGQYDVEIKRIMKNK